MCIYKRNHMQNQEVKGNLAKLLATENLIVEHRVVETASFDVDRRVLVLPIWDVSDRVYNRLVGHEVGHALYTPNTDWSTLEVPKGYINITAVSYTHLTLPTKA